MSEIKIRFAEIREMLPNQSATVYKQILAKEFDKATIATLDITSSKAPELDATAIMQVIIDMDGDARKDIANELAGQELCKLSTANHILSLMKFVKAYHELMS